MKHVFTTLLLVLISSAALASDPDATVRAIYKYSVRGNLEAVRSLMSGDALATLGTAQGLETLKAEAAPFKKVKTTTALVASSNQPMNVRQERYNVTSYGKVNGQKTLLRQFVVDCSIERVVFPGTGCHGRPENGGIQCDISEEYDNYDCKAVAAKKLN